MKIYIGGDHAGFELKNEIKIFLQKLDYEIEDLGPHNYDPTDDYPDFASKVAKAVSENNNSLGIIIGGSGQGEAIVANRMQGIRAAVYYGGPEEIIKLSKEHNNANIFSLGGRFLNAEQAQKAVKLWLETGFSGEERHQRRIEKIDHQ